MPPQQRSGEHLTPAQLTPKIHPKADPRVQAVLAELPEGWQPFETDRRQGEAMWLDVFVDYRDLNVDAWKEKILSEWHRSGRKWAMLKIVVGKHFPSNPAYKGALAKAKGHWEPFFSSTKPAATEDGVVGLIEQVLFFSRPKPATDTSPAIPLNGSSIDVQAETRFVYILRFQFLFFDSIEPEPTAAARLTAPMTEAPLSPQPPFSPRSRRRRRR